jgi:hypothetical protein
MESKLMNILFFVKVITNANKLDKDLRADALVGALYSFLVIRGDSVELHFTANLNQSQIDYVSSFVANFSNASVVDSIIAKLGDDVDPFVDSLLREMRAENMAWGVTQLGKTADVLGVFCLPVPLPGRMYSLSLKQTLDTSTLNVTMEVLTYLIAHPELYPDMAPFISVDRLNLWKTKIYNYLTGA